MDTRSDSPSELLEELTSLTRCCFLSDLPYLSVPCSTMARALRTIPSNCYTCRCWKEAWQYLTGDTTVQHADGAEYRRLLLAYYGGSLRKNSASP